MICIVGADVDNDAVDDGAEVAIDVNIVVVDVAVDNVGVAVNIDVCDVDAVEHVCALPAVIYAVVAYAVVDVVGAGGESDVGVIAIDGKVALLMTLLLLTM